MINHIELQILNPDGSKFIESPVVIPGEQIKDQDIAAQFKIGSILEFAVTGNKLQGEVIVCELSAVDCERKDCHSALDAESSSYTLQVVIKIKPQSPQIIPLTAATND